MTETYIKSIFVENSINVRGLEIPLSEGHRQHFIVTGKNGSGKTSLLRELNKYLAQFENDNFASLNSQISFKEDFEKSLRRENLTLEEKTKFERNLKSVENWLSKFGGTQIKFSNPPNYIQEQYNKGEFLLAFFDAKRLIDLRIPRGIKKIELKDKYKLYEKANPDFIQYIVNLKADRLFAKDDNEEEAVEKIDQWFQMLENRLRQIFEADNLELRFNRKAYNFDIVIDGQETFGFNTLSDGYSAIISIVTELLLRMEAHNVKSYDLEGIVLIDEIETHLHIDLQKKVLPFLTDFFPKIQFIVTTHSPFVISSLSNATICDLETKIVTTDLSAYSYDALIESYFKSDKYSDELKVKLAEFEKLVAKDNKTVEEKIKLKELRDYFSHSPKYFSDELMVKLQQIELNELNK